jgi:3-deoxy-7-phosphoheptulonate synthase
VSTRERPLPSRAPEPVVLRLDDAATVVGGGNFLVIAGPGAVESRHQLLEAAHGVGAAGAAMLRGGAYKPRTSPYSFQGLGQPALKLLAHAREHEGLPVVTEVLDVRDVDAIAAVATMLQIGARNMGNAVLLREVAATGLPVLLKRGFGATVDDLLDAADYVLDAGNARVVLCERGIRTFEHATRYTLDLAAVPVLRERTHLPVIVDPSHAAGNAAYVAALARAAVAVGADGLLVEVHPDPAAALSDGQQSLSIDAFAQLMRDVEALCDVLGTTLVRRSELHAAVS